ncbi:hypothetical protein CBD41_05875 [bacterium TMED181]|nr:hypothetical protein [Planctomycetota bacterium]OUW44314.1 MAG: hypothetical protein CBD41_05875 [bacterium TMED181]
MAVREVSLGSQLDPTGLPLALRGFFGPTGRRVRSQVHDGSSGKLGRHVRRDLRVFTGWGSRLAVRGSSFSESEEHGSETDFEGFLKRGSLQKLDLDGLSESLLHCSMIGLPFQPMKS